MYDHMRTMIWKTMMLAGGLCTLPLAAHAQLLRGVVKGAPVESLTVAYSPTGNVMATEYKDIPVTDGTFVYDTTLGTPYADITVQVSEAIFGAHLEPGKTVEVAVTVAPDGTLACSYAGDNAATNRFYDHFVRAFDMMRYFSPDPSQGKTFEEYCALLQSETDSVRALLPSVPRVLRLVAERDRLCACPAPLRARRSVAPLLCPQDRGIQLVATPPPADGPRRGQ